MSKYTHLMIHCADTPAGVWFDRKDIEQWHLQERGWSRVGYSVLWLLDGTTDILIPYDDDGIIESWEISNGAKGWNGRTRHMCYIGGRGENGGRDTRTPQQLAAMAKTVKTEIALHPEIKLIGHNQVNGHKYCPSFDVPKWAEAIGVSAENIDFNIYHS